MEQCQPDVCVRLHGHGICTCSRSSIATARTPFSALRRATVSSATPNTSTSTTLPAATRLFRCEFLGDDLAAVDDRDPVAERVRLEHVMRREQDRLARLRERGDRCAELARADRIEPDRGLVEEHHRRVVQQAAGDVEALLHPARVALGALVLALEADELDGVLDPRWFSAGTP